MEEPPLLAHVQWLLERRGPDLAGALAREGVGLQPEAALRILMAADPSPRKVAVQWLCDSYLAGGFRWEDAAAGAGSKASGTLRLFAAHRAGLPRAERNLSAHAGLASAYKSVKHLLPAAADANPSGKALRLSERESALSESFVAHRSGDLIVAVPLTENASRWWGKGTRWCTAADSDCAFHIYNRTGPLVVIVLAGRHQGEAVRKWQLHVGRGDAQIMDEDDDPIDPDALEEEWDRVGGILEWAIRLDGNAFEIMPYERRTPEVCLATVRRHGMALQDVPYGLRTPDICLEAVRQDGNALAHVPSLTCTPEMRMEALRQSGDALDLVELRFRTPRICAEAIRRSPMALRYVPHKFRTPRMCLEAVRQDGWALQYVPGWMRGLEALPPKRKDDDLKVVVRDVCADAVRQNGMALQFVAPEVRIPGLYMEAVKQDGRALAFVPKEACTLEICLEALRQNPIAMGYVPGEMMRQVPEALARACGDYRPGAQGTGKPPKSNAPTWSRDILDDLATSVEAHARASSAPAARAV